MKKTLGQWALDNDMHFSSAYRRFKKGQIPNAQQTPKGIIISEPDIQTSNAVVVTSQNQNKSPKFGEVVHATLSDDYKEVKASNKTRRSAATTIIPLDRFKNLYDGVSPFSLSKNGLGKGDSNLNIRDTVFLCQLAYYNFAIFRNIIDVLSELSVAPIYFTGGNKKARQFFEAYFKKINLDSFQDKFFRELFRSGNIFIFPYFTKLQDDDITKITQVFGAENSNSNAIELPAKFIILNPCDIELSGSSSFVTPVYKKLLSDYELNALKNPKTEEDSQILESLDPKTRDLIQNKKTTQVYIDLPMDRIYAVFYKKQDYEPFAVPIGFGVLDDINFKAEIKKAELAAIRAVHQSVLVITLGYLDGEGNYQFSQAQANAIQTIFANESVGKVLIADFTTKAEFLIPDIANILSPTKYENVEKSIKEGLNQILMGGDSEKFANKALAVKLFLQRIVQVRDIFLNDFLNLEIKRISKLLGFKNLVSAKFENIDFKDESEWARIVTRLAEIGLLTPDETLDSIQSGKLPEREVSQENQAEFRKLKDKGFYEPITGGPFTQLKLAELSAETAEKTAKLGAETALKTAALRPKPVAGPSKPAGRPSGTPSPKTKQKVKPIGASFEGFSLTKIKDNLILAGQIQNQIEEHFKKKLKIKGATTEKQKEISQEILEVIMANEAPENWDKNIKSYLEKPVDTNQEKVMELEELKAEYQVDNYTGCILLHSKSVLEKENDES